MNRYGVPAVFRSRKQRWEDRPWQARQWLLHTHGSQKFMRPQPRECPGVERARDLDDALVLVFLIALFLVALAWGLL